MDTRLVTQKELQMLVASSADEVQIWQALEQVIKQQVGVSLFTVLIHDAANGTVQRIYTNDPATYLVGGTKEMGPTPWGDLVLKRGEPFLGRNADDIRWAFPDHETILSLGLGSALNMPMRLMGRTHGTLNLLHRPFHYTTDHIGQVAKLASVVAPLSIWRVLSKECKEA